MLKAAKEGDEDRLGFGSCDLSRVTFLEESPFSSRAVAALDSHRAREAVVAGRSRSGLQPAVPPSRFFGGSYLAGLWDWYCQSEHRGDWTQEEKIEQAT